MRGHSTPGSSKDQRDTRPRGPVGQFHPHNAPQGPAPRAGECAESIQAFLKSDAQRSRDDKYPTRGPRACWRPLAHVCFRWLWEVTRAGCLKTDPTFYEMRKLRRKRGRGSLKPQS